MWHWVFLTVTRLAYISNVMLMYLKYLIVFCSIGYWPTLSVHASSWKIGVLCPDGTRSRGHKGSHSVTTLVSIKFSDAVVLGIINF